MLAAVLTIQLEATPRLVRLRAALALYAILVAALAWHRCMYVFCLRDVACARLAARDSVQTPSKSEQIERGGRGALKTECY